MRTRFVLASILALAITRPLSAEIDFTATPQDYVSQGFACRQLSFKDDATTITIELPSKWTYRSSPERLQLIAPPPAHAEGTLEALPVSAPQPLDQAARDALARETLGAVPPASQQASVVEETENPLLLDGHESIGVTVSFQMSGEIFHRSVVLVNFPKQRLVVRFTAPKAEFASLAASFRRAVTSWQVTQPAGGETAAN